MQVLVTGAAGFIGGSLVKRLLDDGHTVVGLDRFSRGKPEDVPRLTYVQGDVRSSDIAPYFDGVDAVFHLAARNSIRKCEDDPEAAKDINEHGTENVFSMCLEKDVGKVMYASSAVLDQADTRNSVYAKTKAANEAAARRFQEKGLVTVGLRYYNTYGPGDHLSAVGKFIEALVKGERPWLYEGDEKNKRDFIFLDDIHDFHLLSLSDQRVNNKVWSIGTGKNHSIRDVLDAVQKVMGTSVEPEVRPRIPGDMPREMQADISAARSLGWEPKVDLEEGIRRTVPYVRNEFGIIARLP
jgi:nucleoside-diphosphate-sugar epimerase